VLMSEEIYEGLANGAAADVAIGHGFTYSGHPVSAAVGLEVLRLYTEGGILANGQAVASTFAEGLQRLSGHPLVGEARGRGLLGALEVVADRQTKRSFPADLKFSDRLFRRAYENGVIFRAFGDGTIGLAPALCATAEELDTIFDRVKATLDDMMNEGDIRAAMA